MPRYSTSSSQASLQNNIGALLVHESSKSTACSITNLQLAKERFYAAIASGSHLPSFPILPTQIKNRDADIHGLTWFHNKLLRERENNPLPNVLKLEMSHGVPLGLEYINFPITVPTGCEIDATLASILNLSCLMWAEERSLDEVIDTLSWSFKIKTSNNDDTSQESKYKCCQWCNWRTQHELYADIVSDVHNDLHCSSCPNSSLMAIAHNNMGILKFCCNRPGEALAEFDQARRLAEQCNNTSTYPRARIKSQHGTTPVLNIDYLNLAILLNQTRACIRLNDTMRSSALIPKLAVLTLPRATSQSPLCPQLQQRSKFLLYCAKCYTTGLFHQRQEHYIQALEEYNAMLAFTRKELGHNHIHVATVLEKKGNVLFEQRKCQTAMLSYLASLRIYENQISSQACQQGNRDEKSNFWLERSRILYLIGRTLHDREEISDALRYYQRAIRIREEIGSKENGSESIMILCNIGRIFHMLGNLTSALRTNLQLVEMASEMVGGGEAASRHDFVRNRYLVLGNLYVEMGKLEEAMETFAMVARGGNAMTSFDDIDTSTYAVRAAERLGTLRGIVQQHAAAA